MLDSFPQAQIFFLINREVVRSDDHTTRINQTEVCLPANCPGGIVILTGEDAIKLLTLHTALIRTSVSLYHRHRSLPKLSVIAFGYTFALL